MVNRMLFFKLGTEFQSHNYGAMVAIQPLYSHDISFWNGFAGTKMTRKRMVNLIIPGLFEPPVRTLRATIPENESHIFR